MRHLAAISLPMFASRSHAYGGGQRRLAKPLQIKPSDGLEPSTPSLPFRFRGGKHGHSRVSEGTKAPQAGGIRRRAVTRVWTRAVGLVFAPRSQSSWS